MSISNREPKKALKFFEEISRIPRGSGNEEGISDYLVMFAKKRNLMVKQDKSFNVVIYKDGSPGRENQPPIIIQSHMDMVCEKNAGTVHNFLTDPISLRLEGDFLYANGTTLGADNGVGMCIGLAVLDSDNIEHPPLEIVFTSEEETTMKGISDLKGNWLKARRMISLDSGDDESFCVGCAGGGRLDFKVPLNRESISHEMVYKTLTVRGLTGGHSGAEINLGKGNSIRILGRALDIIMKSAMKPEMKSEMKPETKSATQSNIRLVSASGGLKANAIPREAEAIIALPAEEVSKVEQELNALDQVLKNEYRIPDPGITLVLAPAQDHKEVLSRECSQKAIAAMLLLPYGVLHMSYDIPDLVETSNNVGVMETTEEFLSFECALRSSVPSRRLFVRSQIEILAAAMGCQVNFAHGYPGWTYNPESPLLAVALEQFKEMYNKEPNIEAIHAGLECGFMLEKIPDMDIIAYCAKIYDAHTPNEHMSIPSLDRIWKYTLALLKGL